ncbi:MAG: NAD(P)/FAD-dependent oxidoreductase [Dechloromonas sp.]|nr:NAD(P)/FAD-dependent oxidoreductase [Dechloromonas sp.]
MPDDDLSVAIKSGRATVVTDHIETVTENGSRLKSGKELTADIVVTATGLKLLFLAGMAVAVDSRKVDFSRTFGRKGMLFSDVPNPACVFGYTNSSWTLKADLESEYLCRLLRTCACLLSEAGVEAAVEALPELPHGHPVVQVRID